MLQFFRERAHGIFTWIIVGIIIVGFALFGLNSYFSGAIDTFIAKVNDTEISINDFQRAYQNERAFRQQLMGDNFNPALMNDAAIRRDALDKVINTEVLAQYADEAGMGFSDEMLGREIMARQDFQEDGKFDQRRYQRILTNQGLNQARFEAIFRRDLIVNQVVTGVLDTAIVTERDVDALLKIKKEKRIIGYSILKASDYEEEIDVSEEQIKQFYDANLDRYAVPEKVSVSYLELSPADFQKNIEVDEVELREIYEDRLEEFSLPEERKASHILISVGEDADADTVETKRRQAQDLVLQIRDGASFEEMAKIYSEDAGSAESGGDLGFFGRGVMVDAFEEVAFSMIEGEISDPVESPFGFHIIKMVEIKPEQVKPFETVRDKLEKEYIDQQAEDQFYDKAEQLANLTYENPDTLDIAAEELGLTVKTTGLFERSNGAGIAANPRFREAAFLPDVLDAGNNSETIELSPNRLVVLRVKEHQPPSYRPMDEVRGQIETQLVMEAASKKVEDLGGAIIEQTNDGQQIAAVVEEYGLEWVKSKAIERNERTIDPSIVQTAFSMQRPEDGKSGVEGVKLASGDYAIVSVLEVQDVDLTSVETSERESLKQGLLNYYGQQGVGLFVDSVKQQADIREYPDRI